jgi:hypothetical protein
MDVMRTLSVAIVIVAMGLAVSGSAAAKSKTQTVAPPPPPPSAVLQNARGLNAGGAALPQKCAKGTVWNAAARQCVSTTPSLSGGLNSQQ